MTTIAILAITLYLISGVLLASKLRSRLDKTTAINKKVYISIWSIALLLHAVVLYYPLLLNSGLSIGMLTAASHIIWLASLILLFTTLTHNIEVLGLFILPLTALTLLLQQAITPNPSNVIQIYNGLGFHIFSSLMAYSMLMLAAIQAALLAEQNKHLHNHKPTGFIRALPALQDMESLLFRFISVGWLLLTVALITGFIYLDSLFGHNIAHKTILSIIAWFVFGTLLVGHLKFGWRGKTAIRWTLSGFFILMIAFFGSKIVQYYLIGT